MRTLHRTALLCLALVFAACGGADNSADLKPAAHGGNLARAPGVAIPDSYIVLVANGADPHGVARAAGVSPKFVYSIVNGFAATMNVHQLEALQRNPQVVEIEQDQVYTADTTQSGATWGLDRINQRSRPLDGLYTYTTTASTVHAYIIDTGIQTSHPDFGGRASVSYDALGGNGQDCNGHGTHVSGTVGGAKYGVAKGVRLHAVRVLNCSGSGSTSGIISALNWLSTNAIHPAVANMSLGGGFSSTLNTAVNNLASSGVFIAVAAGNSNADACNSSPSSAANATCVASSTSTDAKSSFSNWGGCVDLYAPGSSITSDWLNSGTNTISGTSMATPHVTGTAALYKATFGDASYSTIRSWLTTNATANVITGNPSGTPNKLLYKSTL